MVDCCTIQDVSRRTARRAAVCGLVFALVLAPSPLQPAGGPGPGPVSAAPGPAGAPSVGGTAEETADAPVIAGDPVVDNLLTATLPRSEAAGSWNFQWLANGEPLDGANSRAYRIRPTDFGSFLSVQAIAVDRPERSRRSAAVGPVLGRIRFTSFPHLTGSFTAGSELQLSASFHHIPQILVTQPSVRTRVSWYRDGIERGNQRGWSLRLSPSDIGSRFRAGLLVRTPGYAPAETKTVLTPLISSARAGPEPGHHNPSARQRPGFFLRGRDGSLWSVPVARSIAGPAFPVAGRLDSPGATLASGDMDGDTQRDILAIDRGRLWLYRGLGSGDFAPRVSLGSGWDAVTALVAPGDFDGDAYGDLIVRDGRGVLWLFSGNEEGQLKHRRFLAAGFGTGAQLAAADDFNGDGAADLVFLTRRGALRLHAGDGTGGLEPVRAVPCPPLTGVRIVAAGDYDGDGAADLVGHQVLSGKVLLLRGDGQGSLLSRTVIGLAGFRSSAF